MLPQWLGGTQGLINQAIPAGTDFGAALGAMNPGQAGMAAVPNDAFNQTQPFDVSGVNRPGSGASSQGLVTALGGAAKAAGAGQQSPAAAAAAKPGAPALGQAPLGTPRAAVSLNNLVDMLAKRRNMYLQAAMSPGGGVPGAQNPSAPTGLLGF